MKSIKRFESFYKEDKKINPIKEHFEKTIVFTDEEIDGLITALAHIKAEQDIELDCDIDALIDKLKDEQFSELTEDLDKEDLDKEELSHIRDENSENEEDNPWYEAEDCEDCLAECEENGIEYEQNMIWKDGAWHCESCGKCQ